LADVTLLLNGAFLIGTTMSNVNPYIERTLSLNPTIYADVSILRLDATVSYGNYSIL